MYELRCLGEASLRNASGDLIRFRSRKHLALLIYLALNAKRAHRRERLAGLLWSESDDSRARHSLSQALYAVRRTLNGTIRIDGEDLEISGDDLWVDSIELEKRLKSGDPAGAAEMYRGDFLEGFWIRGGHGFEDWAERERARVGAMARDALRQAIKMARDRCEWSEVTARAERLVQLDPFDEAAYTELMRALWMIGDRATALERYEELRRVLADELGSSPSTETEELVARIRSRPVRGGWNGRPLVREKEPSPFDNPPFVGRKKELAILAEEWERVKAGETRAVALVGEAGIGKTRLANEFIKSLALEDVVVLRGRCYQAEQSLPYGPVAEALREGLADLDLSQVKALWLAELARIVPEVGDRYSKLPDPPELEAEGGRNRFFEGLAQIFKAACEVRPALLYIDDLHWADESSLALMHYLVRRVTSGLYVITGHRPEELGTRGQPGPAQLVQAHSRDTRTVTISPLNQSDSWHLISELIAAHIDRQAVETLRSMSEGNPFLAIELAKDLPDEAKLERSLPRVPESIKALFERKFASLENRAVAFMELAAFIGSKISYETLHAALKLPLLDFQVILTDLLSAGILVEEKAGVRFRHDLIRDVARQRVSVDRGTNLHAKAARALVRSRGSAGEIARHFSAAGDARRAHSYALRAAKNADRVFAIEEEADLLRIAMLHAPTEATRIEVMGRLGKLYWRMRRYEKARPLFVQRLKQMSTRGWSKLQEIECRLDLTLLDAESCRSTAKECANQLRALYSELNGIECPPRLLAKILHRLFWVGARCGDPDLAAKAIARTRSLHREVRDPSIRCLTARILAIDGCYRGDFQSAEMLLRQAMVYASRQDQLAGVDCYIGLSVLASRAMRTNLVREILGPGRRLAQLCGDPGRESTLLMNCAVFYMHRRELDRAESLLLNSRQLVRGVGDFLGNSSIIDFNQGYVALLKGAFESAERLLLRSLNASIAFGREDGLVDSCAALGELTFRRGDLPRARCWAARALRGARHLRWYVDECGVLEKLLAQVRFAAGRPEKALAHLAQAAAAGKRGDAPLYLEAQLTRLEFLAKVGLGEEAEHVKRELSEFATSHGATWYIAQAEVIDTNLR